MSTKRSSKYGELISDSWRWSCDHDLDIVGHALRRWDERTPYDSVAPETAWEFGAVIHHSFHGVFKSADGELPDEVRTFFETTPAVEESYQAVLIARDGVIKTVLDMSRLSGPERAYLNAMRPYVTYPAGGDSS